MARLNHPNIVGIYDFGQADGLYFFVMEYVEGLSVRQLINNHQLSPPQALALVPQICEALQFAHDEGIVHRDVKPENILIDQRGRVKVADFGLAKLLGLSADKLTLTRVEQVMGTPLYMAPEQMQGSHAVDHRADIYSLGVVFYEMLTGELPLGRFAPPSQKVDVDVRLDEVVLRALEREPDRRYQHASDVKTDVDAIAARPAATVGASPTADTKNACATRVRRAAIGLFILGVVGCIASFVFLMALATIWVNTTGRNAPPNQSTNMIAFSIGCIGLLSLVALSVLAMLAAWKMFRFQAYALALIMSLVAIVTGPLFIVSLPIGVWALVVLLRRDVRSEFSAVRKARQDARRPEREMGRHRNVVPLVTVLSALACLMGMGTAFLPWAEFSRKSAMGFMWWQGMFVCFAFMATAALLLATVSMARMPAWRPVVVGMGALAVIAAAAHFLAEFSRGDLPAEPLLTAAKWSHPMNGKTPSTIREANLNAIRRNGAYLAMLVAAGVLMLTAVETAVAHARDRSPADHSLPAVL